MSLAVCSLHSLTHVLTIIIAIGRTNELTRYWTPIDNEFTQLMKGLQGERLRQAFKYLDTNMDGYILPDQFKRIILVCSLSSAIGSLACVNDLIGCVGCFRNCQATSFRRTS